MSVRREVENPAEGGGEVELGEEEVVLLPAAGLSPDLRPEFVVGVAESSGSRSGVEPDFMERSSGASCIGSLSILTSILSGERT